MGDDAGSVNAAEVIDALARCVHIMGSDIRLRSYLERAAPHYLAQANQALALKAQWEAQPMKVIPNFDDQPDDDILEALHDYYATYDTTEEEED